MMHGGRQGRSSAGRPGSHRLLPFAGIAAAIVAVLAHLGGGAALMHAGLDAVLTQFGLGALVVSVAAVVTLKLLVVFGTRRLARSPKEQPGMTTGKTLHRAHWYDACGAILMLGRGRALRERTIALAGVARGESVLDVGCGTGELTLCAKARSGAIGSVAGIDASPEMIAVAREKAARARVDIDFCVAAVESLPFADATFDVVLSSLMMHHLPEELRPRALTEIRRVLKPGGRLLVVDFKEPTSRLGRLMPVWLLHRRLPNSLQELPRLLEAAGFPTVTTGETGFGYLGFVRGRAGQ